MAMHGPKKSALVCLAFLADREADFRAGQVGPVDLVVRDGEVPQGNINSQG